MTVSFTYCSQQEEDAKSPEIKEMLDEVGFTYFLIIARLHDLDPKLAKKETLNMNNRKSL
jgi:hypothetical protein